VLKVSEEERDLGVNMHRSANGTDKMARAKWYGQNGIGHDGIRTKRYRQNGMVKMVRTKWYGQNGTDKMVWTKWYGQNGTDKMVQSKWYGQNGMDKMARMKWYG